jgi:hypothetical protein
MRTDLYNWIKFHFTDLQLDRWIKARVLATSTLTLGSAQSTSGYSSGTLPICVGSSNVIYSSTVAGSCTTGTSSYDIPVSLERLQ